MSLNIKNEETHRLARELASLTGESVTTAVSVAVQERLRRLQAQRSGSLAERLLEIGKDCAQHLNDTILSLEHGDLLYDDLGLPK